VRPFEGLDPAIEVIGGNGVAKVLHEPVVAFVVLA